MRRWRILAPFTIGIAFLSTLVLHGELGAYSRFIADDYCSAGIAERFGIPRAVWYWYLNWTGRYSASALDAVFGLLGPRVTPFVPAAVLIIWLVVLTCSFVMLAARSRPRSIGRSFILGLSLLYVTLALSPAVPQSLYWGQGMRSIVPPLILGTVYADLALWFSRNAWPVGRYALWLVVAFLLAFFMGGLNETFTALEVSSLVFAFALAWVAGVAEASRRTARFLLAGALGAGLALLLVMSAPGNAFRQAFYPPPPGLPGILRISTTSFAAFLGQIMSTPERWTAMLGAVGVAASAALQAPGARPKRWLAPLIVGVGMAFSFLCFIPAAYGLSDAPPDRTLMIPAYLIGATAMLAGFVLARGFAPRAPNARWPAGLEAWVLVVSAAACMVSASLSDTRLAASRATYAAYAAHWDRVNTQILQAVAQGKDQVFIQPMENWAALNEPNDNPKFWVNVCYRDYYGIEVLAASQP